MDHELELLQHYKLTEECCDRQVTDSHLEDISGCCCGQWRSLPSHLEMEMLVARDIEHEHTTEQEKRKDFLFAWKQKKGFHATYRKLVNALLRIDCRDDAGKVCKLLQESFFTQQPRSPLESNPTQTSDSTGMYKLVILLHTVKSV